MLLTLPDWRHRISILVIFLLYHIFYVVFRVLKSVKEVLWETKPAWVYRNAARIRSLESRPNQPCHGNGDLINFKKKTLVYQLI